MKLLAFALLVLLLAMPAYGQDFQKGAEAYNRGDYSAALWATRMIRVQRIAPPWLA